MLNVPVKGWLMELTDYDTNCPCIDCLTLSICKAVLTLQYNMWITLSGRCCIFKEYYGNKRYDSQEWITVRKLYNIGIYKGCSEMF